MKKPVVACALALVTLLGSSVPARAEIARVVSGARVLVRDVVPGAPPELADVDLGALPPPGGSRLVGRDDVVQAIRRAGKSERALAMTSSVRVTAPSRRIGRDELARIAREPLERAAPRGTRLVKVETPMDLVVPPGVVVDDPPPFSIVKKKGEQKVPLVLALVSPTSREIAARVPVTVTLDVSESALVTDVKKGDPLTVVVERAGLRITARGVAQDAVNIGEILRVVSANGRSHRARLRTREEAVLVEGT